MNGLFLTVGHAMKGNVDFKQGILYGGIGLIGLAPGLVFQREILEKFRNYLKGGFGWILLTISVVFFVRAYILRKRQKVENEIYYVDDSESDIVNSDNDYDSGKGYWRPESKRGYIALVSFMVFFSILSGGLCGLLGVGSGMNFAMMFVFAKKMDIFRAAGTSCMIMTIYCATNLFTLYVPGIVTVDYNTLWPYFSIIWGVGLISVILSFFLLQRFSRIVLNIIVGIVLFLMGTIAVIEFFVFMK